jgi:heme/copper-type cytochrome/quinol oxidase subunit 4
MFMFQTLKFIPAHVLFIEGEILGIMAFGIAIFIWVLIPFIKVKERPNAKIQIMTIVGLIVASFIIIMTIAGYLF